MRDEFMCVLILYGCAIISRTAGRDEEKRLEIIVLTFTVP